jgi:hypothetical protein
VGTSKKSATLTALIWLVLVQIQPSPASAATECVRDCPVIVVVATIIIATFALRLIFTSFSGTEQAA